RGPQGPRSNPPACRPLAGRAKSKAWSAWRPRRSAGGGSGPRLHRQQALALHALAGKLARPSDRFRLLTRLLLRGLFVMAAKLHLAKMPLALHLLLQRFGGLVDVVVRDETLHASVFCSMF